MERVKSNHILKASAIVFIGQMFVNGLNYFLNILLGRILADDKFGTSAFGEFWALNSLASYLIIPITALILVSTQQISEYYAKKDYSNIKIFFSSSVKILAMIAIVLSLIGIAVSPILKSFLHINSILAIIVTILGITIGSLYPTLIGITAGLQKFVHQSIILVTGGISKTIVAIILSLAFGVTGAVSGNLALSITQFIVGFILVSALLHSYQPTNLQPINFPWKFFLSACFSTLAFGSFLSTDVIVIKHFLTDITLNGSDIDVPSLYSALSLFGRIIYYLTFTFATVLLPLSAYSKAKDGKQLQVLSKIMGLTLMCLIPLLILYFAVPDLLIKFSFGEKYLPVSKYLGSYGVAVSFYAIASLLNNYFLSLKKIVYAVIPAFFAVTQIILIFFFHESIADFIKVLFSVNLLMLISFAIYFILESRISSHKSVMLSEVEAYDL